MTEPIELDDLLPDRAMSRRNLIVGAGVTALGMSAALSAGSVVEAAPHADALTPAVAGLQYIALDEVEFWPDGNYNGGQDPRVIDTLSGVGIAFTGVNNAGQLSANIPLPTGAVIRQINVAYQGTPIVNVYGRALTNPKNPGQHISKVLAGGGGPKSQTIALNGAANTQLAPIPLKAATSYTLRFYVGKGDSIYAATIGYTPPLQGFVPVAGHQRVLDTRTTGGKLKPGEVRTVAAGVAGARSAMFSLIVLGTEGTGAVSCFPANVAYPGNASITWFGSGQTLENTVVCAVDSKGAIKIRGGTNRTHVIIDRIGHFY
jgi:hypothetical protein